MADIGLDQAPYYTHIDWHRRLQDTEYGQCKCNKYTIGHAIYIRTRKD